MIHGVFTPHHNQERAPIPFNSESAMLANVTTTEFRPIPAALIERIHARTDELAIAQTPGEQLRALFLAHAEIKDAEALIAKDEESAQVAIRINQN